MELAKKTSAQCLENMDQSQMSTFHWIILIGGLGDLLTYSLKIPEMQMMRFIIWTEQGFMDESWKLSSHEVIENHQVRWEEKKGPEGGVDHLTPAVMMTMTESATGQEAAAQGVHALEVVPQEEIEPDHTVVLEAGAHQWKENVTMGQEVDQRQEVPMAENLTEMNLQLNKTILWLHLSFVNIHFHHPHTCMKN